MYVSSGNLQIHVLNHLQGSSKPRQQTTYLPTLGPYNHRTAVCNKNSSVLQPVDDEGTIRLLPGLIRHVSAPTQTPAPRVPLRILT